jgi:hypothetical protein
MTHDQWSMLCILPLLNLSAQEFEEQPGAFLSQGPDLKGRGDGRLWLQDFSPAGWNQQAVQGSGDAEKKKRGACDLKPWMRKGGKPRNHKSCNDLPFAPLGAHRYTGGGRIGHFLQSVFVTVEEEKGLIRGEEGSQAEEPILGGQEADEFLLALPQHRPGDLGVGAHGVVLEPDTLAFSYPALDKSPAKVQHDLFALLLKGSLGDIASRPFFPEGADVLP